MVQPMFLLCFLKEPMTPPMSIHEGSIQIERTENTESDEDASLLSDAESDAESDGWKISKWTKSWWWEVWLITFISECVAIVLSGEYFRISLGGDKNKWGKWSILLISGVHLIKYDIRVLSSTASVILPLLFLFNYNMALSGVISHTYFWPL